MAADTADTVDTVPDGNTISSGIRCRSWSITWFDYPDDHLKNFDTLTQSYLYQIERCPRTDRLHIQGAVRFSNAVRPKHVQSCFPGANHSPARNWKKLLAYVSKDDTSTGERFGNIPPPKGNVRPVPDPMAFVVPTKWQSELADLVSVFCEPADARTIHWYWSRDGGMGKTSIAKHLVLKHPDEIVYVSTAKGADIKYAVAGFLAEKRELRAVIYNVPRDCREISYSTLEELCDGMFFSGKYESRSVVFAPIHVIVFANRPPEKSRLSEDRWDIHQIGE